MGWRFDEARLTEDVLKPMTRGWHPRSNLFLVYQLPDDVRDEAQVALALDGVRAALPRFARSFADEAARLKDGHKQAAEILRDPRARAAHGEEIHERLRKLQDSLADRLAGAPGLPAAACREIVEASGGTLSLDEVRRALAECSAAVKDPVPLEMRARHPQWQRVPGWLGQLGHRSLWEYLTDTVNVREPWRAQSDAVELRLANIRALRDATTPVERSLIAALKAMIQAGQLGDVLMYEVLDDVGQQATKFRFDEVVARARALQPRLVGLGVAALPDDVAYAVWCQRRYGAAAAPPGPAQVLAQALAAEADGDLDGALVTLEAAGSSRGKDGEAAVARLRAKMEEARATLARARGLERSDPEQAAEAYLAVLAVMHSADAEAGLRRCPPPPPPRLTADEAAGEVALTWPACPMGAGDVGYTVVRRAGRAPVSSTDGDVIVDGAAERRAVDPRPPTAAQLYYAVFAVRADAASAPAVAGPVVVLKEVGDLVVEPSADAVAARWRLPEGAVGVEVERRGSPGPTRTLTDAGREQFTDRDVRPGVTYEYLLRARYRLPDGSTTTTPGVTVEGRCQEVPVPVAHLEADPDGTGVHLRWDAPPRGAVQIRLAADAVPARGTLLAASRLNRLGAPPPEVTLRTSSSCHVRLDGTRRATIVAVTVLQDLAVVGASVIVDRRVQPVTGLKAVREGTQVRLSWIWPEGATQARVLVTEGQPAAGVQDPGARRHLVGRAVYEALGVALDVPPGDHWFGVCTLGHVGGRAVFSSVVSVREAMPREVTCRLRRPRVRRRGELHLMLGTDAPQELPALRLVGKERARPRAPEDGTEIARWEAGEAGEDNLVVLAPGQRPLHLRLFSESSEVLLRALDPAEWVIT